MSNNPPIVTVHPRVCGEQAALVTWASIRFGSSPRVRGTVDLRDIMFTHRRFIPACAGNSRPARQPRPPGPVHPRVCGEQPRYSPLDSFRPGSSPRVRGTGPGSDRSEGRHRFIPACAGNSRVRTSGFVHSKVHPRVCGEQSEDRSDCFRHAGSSPRVRGTADRNFRGWLLKRFIPACAGNSTTTSTAGTSKPVHPRVCGEQPSRTRSIV